MLLHSLSLMLTSSLIAYGNEIWFSGYKKVDAFDIVPPSVKDLEEFLFFHNKSNLSCICNGKPQPRVTWYKNGEVLPSTNEIVVDDINIYFRVSSEKSTIAGVYHCQATNAFGSVNSTKVKVANIQTAIKEKVEISHDEALTLECKYYRSQLYPFEVNLFWTHNPSDDAVYLSDGTVHFPPNSISSDAKCRIHYWEPVDLVIVTISRIVKKNDLPLRWMFKPEVVRLSPHMSTGDEYSFWCLASQNEANSKMVISYIDSDGEHFGDYEGIGIELRERKFYVKKKLNKVEGNFSCATEKLNKLVFPVKLPVSISISVNAPSVLEMGGTYRIACRGNSSGSEISFTEMLRENNVISKDEDPRLKITKSGANIFLNIKNATGSDAGTYQCRFKADNIEKIKVFTLKAKEYVPSMDFKSTKSTGTSIQIFWKAKGQDDRIFTKLVYCNQTDSYFKLGMSGDEISGLEPLTNYTFILKMLCAHDSCLRVTNMNPLRVRTGEGKPTGFVSKMKADIVNGTLVISYKLPINGWVGIPSGAKAYLYDAYRNENQTAISGDGTFITFSNLKSNTNYLYSVAIKNSVLAGQWNAHQEITTPVLEPSLVQNLRSYSSFDRIFFSFDEPHISNGEILTFALSIDGHQKNHSIFKNFTFNDLTPNTSYTLCVAATNRIGEGNQSCHVSKTTLTGKPDQVKNIFLREGAYIFWEPGDGPGAEYFIVSCLIKNKLRNSSRIYPVLPFSYNMKLLSGINLHQCQLRVYAINKFGASMVVASNLFESAGLFGLFAYSGKLVYVFCSLIILIVMASFIGLLLYVRNTKHEYKVAEIEESRPADAKDFSSSSTKAVHTAPRNNNLNLDAVDDDVISTKGFRESGSFIGAYAPTN